MDFRTALEDAISLGRRRALSLAATVSVLGFVCAIGAWQLPDVDFELPFVALVVAIGIWPVALSGTKGSRALAELRGAEPQHWLPSRSHGILVVAGDFLVAGDLRAELKRRSTQRRVSSIAYDDTDHTMLIAVITTRHYDDGGMRDEEGRVDVRLDPSVSAERAQEFAKHALELSQR